MDFIYQLGGVHPGDGHAAGSHFRDEQGELSAETPALVIDERITLPKPIFGDDFTALASMATTATPKLTIPSPSMVHYRGGPAALDPDVYPDMDQFWDDLSAAYAQQVAAVAELGLHLPAVRRHQPRLPQRPRAAGRC